MFSSITASSTWAKTPSGSFGRPNVKERGDTDSENDASETPIGETDKFLEGEGSRSGKTDDVASGKVCRLNGEDGSTAPSDVTREGGGDRSLERLLVSSGDAEGDILEVGETAKSDGIDIGGEG
jgi:hypothetical protein